MKYTVIDSNNKFTGVVYNTINTSIIAYHAKSNEKLISINRDIVDSGTKGSPSGLLTETVFVPDFPGSEKGTTETKFVVTAVVASTSNFGAPTVQELKDGLTAVLWESCTAYQSSRIDATGLVGMMYKAQQGGSKAIAIVTWVNNLWAEYYARKTAITGGSVNVSIDFSSMGELPYSYYEASAQ